MKRKRLSSHCRERNIVILFVLFIPSLIFSGQAVKITLLATSDMHGHIHNWDYFKNQESPQGLSVVSTLVKQERVVDPDLLLFDAGDVIQGSPLVYYHNTYRPDLPNPMALVKQHEENAHNDPKRKRT